MMNTRKYFVSIALVVSFAVFVFMGKSQEGLSQTNTTIASTDPLPTTSRVPQAPTPVQVPVAVSTPPPKPVGQYRDGTYTGTKADSYYGIIQVQAKVAGGRLADVRFLMYPKDQKTSQQINEQAIPKLRSEAIKAQSAKVDSVSGASDSSAAFSESLGVALSQATNS
jgi:uncharacterized protein with FMN-binding domain